MRNYIIGGGISGCVFAFYHPDYFLIDEDKPKSDSPFIFIQENRYTKKLLSDIGLNPEVISVSVSADNSDKVLSNKSGSEVKKYIGTDKIANIGKNNELFVYNITERDICKEILKSVKDRVFKGMASGIGRDKIHISNGTSNLGFEYDRIVSTIHFEDFRVVMPSWKSGNNYSTTSLFYDIADTSEKGSSITYYNGDCSKVVINSIQGKIAKEYKTGSASNEIKRARISGTISPPPEKITFLGRFANCNPHWRIEDSIYIAQNGLELSDILDEQRRFDEAVKLKSDVGMDLRMQSLILGAHSELSELLEQIPYGPHKNSAKSKIMDSKNILMESIDVIKYMLAVMHEFNFTPREVYEMFFTKSNILWERFTNDFYGGV